ELERAERASVRAVVEGAARALSLGLRVSRDGGRIGRSADRGDPAGRRLFAPGGQLAAHLSQVRPPGPGYGTRRFGVELAGAGAASRSSDPAAGLDLFTPGRYALCDGGSGPVRSGRRDLVPRLRPQPWTPPGSVQNDPAGGKRER